MPSQIYLFEDEDRKKYISNWIRKTLNISKSDSIDNYRFELNKLLRISDTFLDEDQSNLKRYYKGELNKSFFIKDTYIKIQNKIQKDSIKKIKKTKKIRYTPIPNKEYTILKDLDKKGSIKQYGYIKEKRVLVRLEKVTSKKGTEFIRYRDNKGRFARRYR